MRRLAGSASPRAFPFYSDLGQLAQSSRNLVRHHVAKALRGASFKNVDDLRHAIEAFVAAYNPKAKPFKWRKREVKGSQLRNTIVNLCN